MIFTRWDKFGGPRLSESSTSALYSSEPLPSINLLKTNSCGIQPLPILPESLPPSYAVTGCPQVKSGRTATVGAVLLRLLHASHELLTPVMTALQSQHQHYFFKPENDDDPPLGNSEYYPHDDADLLHSQGTANRDEPDAESKLTSDLNHLQKRRRVTRACDECRRKKIKCDGKQPCTHCTVYSYGKHPTYWTGFRYVSNHSAMQTALMISRRTVAAIPPHSMSRRSRRACTRRKPFSDSFCLIWTSMTPNSMRMRQRNR